PRCCRFPSAPCAGSGTPPEPWCHRCCCPASRSAPLRGAALAAMARPAPGDREDPRVLTHGRHPNDALQAAPELDADQREAALGALDPELAQRVRAALQALDGEDVLAAAADRAHSGRTAAEQLGSEMPVGAAIGEEVGGFTLVAALGEGGMARVYAAE